jgi:Tfp pilus assembly protein PilF
MQCSKCGINIEIYKKSKAISIKLYNKALTMANSQDISSAIENLNKSVEFDKTNYVSRNLLGLLYFEVGEIGNALKQWIISNSYSKDKNSAKQYIDTVQNDSRKLEKYNDAIKMYNKALNYMKQKSEDMAIIQLKKALEINPKFIEAYNLLTLCYLYLKDNTKALA